MDQQHLKMKLTNISLHLLAVMLLDSGDIHKVQQDLMGSCQLLMKLEVFIFRWKSSSKLRIIIYSITD